MILQVSKTDKGYLISVEGSPDTLVEDKQKAIQLIKFMAGNMIRQADKESNKPLEAEA